MSTETIKTEVGSYFIANYPPFSQWTTEAVADVRAALNAPPADVPLGLYLHMPFCRKRCKFCYFRVYTDKNAEGRRALRRGAVARDRTGKPAAGHGGPAVPLCLFRRRNSLVPQRQAVDFARRSVTGKHQLGPGRGSHLRVRAGHALAAQARHAQGAGHNAAQPGNREFQRRRARRKWPGPPVGRSLQILGLDPALGFPNTNIDLIAGMVGETEANWHDCIRRTIDLGPDSVTIYQMELPFNTVYSQDILGNKIETPVADWPTKRAWVDYAFDELAGGRLLRYPAPYTTGARCLESEFQLSRQPVARQRSAGHRAWPVSAMCRACIIRTCPTGMATWRARTGRIAAVARAEAQPHQLLVARADPATEDRQDQRGLFPPKVRRRRAG